MTAIEPRATMGMMGRAREPWERQDGESEIAYTRFKAYLELEPPRERARLPDLLGATREAINNMATRHRWTDRATAWDNRIAQRAAEAAMEGAAEMQRKHLGAVASLLSRGLKLIDEGEGDARAGAKMVTEAVRLERLIIGEATDRTEAKISAVDRDPDLSRLTEAEREEWLAGLEDESIVRWLELDDKARGR